MVDSGNDQANQHNDENGSRKIKTSNDQGKVQKNEKSRRGESLRLEEEEGKIEFMRAEGRPENFLGL